METMIFLVGITAAIVINTLIAYLLGRILTEVVTLPLDFRPFNCRPCLTFWLTVALNCLLAWTAVPTACVANRLTIIYGIAGAGVLAGLINFLYIKLKFRIYD